MARKDCTDLEAVVAQIALAQASSEGLGKLDDVVVRMKKRLPQITREEVASSIEAYIRPSEKNVVSQTKKAVSSIKNEAKTDVRLRKKIEEIEKGLGSEDTKVKVKASTEAIKLLKERASSLQRVADLKKQIASLEKQVETGDINPPKKRTPREKTDAVKQLEAARSELKRKADLIKQIQDLNTYRQTITKGNVPKKSPVVRKISEEIEALEFKRNEARLTIEDKIRRLSPKSIFQKAAEPFNMSRALMTSLDVSAVLRQGGFVALGHPIRASKSLIPMFKAFASEKQAFKIMKEIEERPNNLWYKRAKLDFTEVGGKFSKQEEAMMSIWADKIPLVAGSQRAFVTFLNKLRADSFDAMKSTLSKNGNLTIEQAKALGNYINVATGRGDLGRLGAAATTLNATFFSPKLVSSRFQLLYGQPLLKGGVKTKDMRRVKRLIAMDYARFLTGFGVSVGLLQLAFNGEVEFDPRSSDFLKIKVGRTRIDIGAGLLQPIVLMSRIGSGETKSSITGEVTPIRGDVPYGKDDVWDVTMRFMRTKFAPPTGLAVDLSTGTNVVGEPVTVSTVDGVKKVAKNMLVPLSFREIGEAMKEQDIPKATAMSALNLLGAGLSTYGPVPAEK